MNHATLDHAVCDFGDFEFDCAVIEQNWRTLTDLLVQLVVSNRYTFHITVAFVGMQAEGFAGYKIDRPAVQQAGANLDTTRIDHDSDVGSELAGGDAQMLDLLLVRVMRAMRQVQACHVHTRVDHRLQHFG